MRRRPSRSVTALALTLFAASPLAWAGGHHRAPSSTPTPIAPELPATQRGSLEPVAAQLPVRPPATPPAPEIIYRQLNVQDCQCCAVQFAPLAGALARERQALADAHPCCEKPLVHCLMPCHCDDRANKLRQAILYYTEIEIRNRAAGAALELYVGIAEAEAKTDILKLGSADLLDAHGQASDLSAKGFKLPIELASLERQRLDAEADRARLHAVLIDLNAKLKPLIGQDRLPDNERLWPAAPFTMSHDSIDADEAVRIALANRAELQLLRILACDLDAKTLPVVREFLKGVSAGLGAQGGSNSPFVKMIETCKALLTSHAAERGLRDGQIQQLLAERERAVTDEVRRAVAALANRGQVIDLDRQRVLSWQSRVDQVRDRMTQGGASFLDLLQAKLEWYRTRAQLTVDVMEWHRAFVQMRTAQGVLVPECGGQ